MEGRYPAADPDLSAPPVYDPARIQALAGSLAEGGQSMNPLFFALLMLFGTAAIAFTLGFALGRMGERRRFVAWLLQSSWTVHWRVADEVMRREHRK